MALKTVTIKSVINLSQRRVIQGVIWQTYRMFHLRWRSYRNLSYRARDTAFRRTHAQEIILRMSPEERTILLEELHNFEKVFNPKLEDSPSNVAAIVKPTGSQLRAVGLINATPFIGFGFLDNFIMIVAGDYIDMTLGTALGISTMAAAALGNLISDVAGVGSAWYVETLSSKIGIKAPTLSPEQLTMNSTIWSIYLGRAVGVTIGCLLGMMPLLFLHSDKKSKPES